MTTVEQLKEIINQAQALETKNSQRLQKPANNPFKGEREGYALIIKMATETRESAERLLTLQGQLQTNLEQQSCPAHKNS